MRCISRLALLGLLGLFTFLAGPAATPAAAQSDSTVVLRGDVNGDGSITAMDGLAVLSHVVGKSLPPGYTISPNGDADDNGQVTALDALIILAFVVGKDVSQYPVGKPVVTATGLVIAGGDGQVGVVGNPPPDFLRVRAVNATGRGIRNIRVTWTVIEGGGSIRPLAEATDSTGEVAAVFTLGPQPGTNRVTASAPGLGSVTFTATGRSSAPTTVTIVAGNNQSATVGTAVATAPSVRVTDSGNNPVANATVTFRVASGGGSVTDSIRTTDDAGIATVGSWTLGTTAGTNTLTANIGS
ncbi:MAG TPA: dockerin type I domain-containing protein, partial [Longimicrobiaceae bacterium]|nr:dockerin type I domain-containing protein [Longimicrobiaceae bacterium]